MATYTVRQQVADAMRYFNFDRAARIANVARESPRLVDSATSRNGKRKQPHSATELRRKARALLHALAQDPEITMIHQHPLLVVQTGQKSDDPRDRMLMLFMVGEAY